MGEVKAVKIASNIGVFLVVANVIVINDNSKIRKVSYFCGHFLNTSVLIAGNKQRIMKTQPNPISRWDTMVHAPFKKVIKFDLICMALGIVMGIGIGVFLFTGN